MLNGSAVLAVKSFVFHLLVAVRACVHLHSKNRMTHFLLSRRHWEKQVSLAFDLRINRRVAQIERIESNDFLHLLEAIFGDCCF